MVTGHESDHVNTGVADSCTSQCKTNNFHSLGINKALLLESGCDLQCKTMKVASQVPPLLQPHV